MNDEITVSRKYLESLIESIQQVIRDAEPIVPLPPCYTCGKNELQCKCPHYSNIQTNFQGTPEQFEQVVKDHCHMQSPHYLQCHNCSQFFEYTDSHTCNR